MTDITGTWATIPDCPKYEMLYDCSKGYACRKKKEPMGYRNGIKSRGFTGGRILQAGPDGMVALKNHPNMMAERYPPVELHDHTFKGTRLIKPSERKEIRIREAAERRAANQLNRDMTSE